MSDENKLIASVINGHDGYAHLVERYHVGLIIHCERLVGSREDAEDLAQEAFIKAYENLKTYNAKQARFSTWLYRIATNLCIDYLRRQKRKVDVEDIEMLAEPTMPTYMEDEEKAAVRSAVKKLQPPAYRTAIEAYYWQGKNYQQIAEELGVPLNTVRTWMRRAKSQLKEKLI